MGNKAMAAREKQLAAELREKAELGWDLAMTLGKGVIAADDEAGPVLGCLRAACMVAVLDPGHTAEEIVSAVTLCLNAAFQVGRGNYGVTNVNETT